MWRARYFALMENVKHLLSAEMRPMMEYILKEDLK